MGQIFVPDRRIIVPDRRIIAARHMPRMGALQQALASQQIAGGGGAGTITHIDNKGGGGNLSAYPAAALSAASTADTICGWVYWQSTTITLNSVTDGTNTYTLIHNPTTVDTTSRYAMFYCLSVTAGTFTVTANLSGAAFGNVIVHLIRGSGAVTLDKSALASQGFPGTGTDAVSSGNVTTTTDGQYIFGASAKVNAAGNVLTAGTGFTSRTQQNNSGAASLSESRTQTSAGAIAATFTTSSDGFYGTGIMTFKSA